MNRWCFGIFVLCVGFAASAVGCQKRSIQNDFKNPFEKEDLLMPAASYQYLLTGPRGTSVDIAVDYETNKDQKVPVQLTVESSDARRHFGVRVPGSGMRQAVCGVSLEPRAGVRVQVRNLQLLRSVPFAIRIERAPSPICSPQTTVPTMILVHK
jgi:hypothetical protein